jgi:hypothetical protein
MGEEGIMLAETTSKTLANHIQRGIQDHFGVLSNVVPAGDKFEVRVISTESWRNNRTTGAQATGYALGMIDLDAIHKGGVS